MINDPLLYYTTVTRTLNLTGLQWWYPNKTRYVDISLYNNSNAYARQQVEPAPPLDLYGTGPKG